MADTQYINYGNEQIELLALLNNLSNEVLTYVTRLPWSTKRKEKFMSAYTDLMNRGIKGASNSTGLWVLDINGDPLPWDSMSKKDKEMYQEAAYFIQQQMSRLPTKSAKEKEEKKEDLPTFDSFQDNFINYISKQHFGNNKIRIGQGEEDDWNYLDERDSNGIRGTKNRAARLAQYLKEYLDSLNEGDYSFENSPYANLDDLKNRIGTAILALNDGTIDLSDRDALNAIGLRTSDWFNNGSGDPSDTVDANGNRLTWAQKALYNQVLDKQKLELEVSRQEELASRRFTHMRHYPKIGNLNGTQLTDESLATLLDNLNNFRKLDNNDLSRLAWAIKNGNLIDVPKEELNLLAPEYRNNPKRLKKISGIEGIYYDTIGQRLYQPYSEGLAGVSTILDVIKLNDSKTLKEKLLLANLQAMNSPINWQNLDEASKNELWAVVNDIAAFVDPEAVSGTAFALNAARLRDKNRAEGWSWERGLDWFTSALGGLPVIGDAASVIKAGNNLVKLANRSARIGSLIASVFAAANVPEAWDSIKKIYSKGITSITPLDVLNITYGLMGFAAGWKTINSINARPKTKFSSEHSIEIDGKKVVLPEEVAIKIESEYKSAKNNKEASDKIIKMQEVRDAAKKAGIEITDVSQVTSGSGFLRGNPLSRKLGITKSPISTNPVATGATEGSSSRYWMPRIRRSFLTNKVEVSNPLRKTFDWYLGKEGVSTKPVTEPTSSEINIPAGRSDERGVLKPYTKPSQSSRELPPVDHTPRLKPTELAPNPKKVSHTEAKKLIRNLKKGKFSNELPKDGTITFRDAQGNTIEWKLLTRDNDFLFSGKSTDGTSFAQSLNLDNLKSSIYTKLMDTFNNNGVRSKIELPAYVIKQLLGTAYSWFKQGGKITDLQINKFLKQYK